MMDAAKLYAERYRFAVFPIAEDCRRPLTPHGFKDAAKDAGDVEALWRRHPEANIAVACGAASGAFVIDVDVKTANGFRTLSELEATHGALPATWRTRTPSGGCHFWFRQPARTLRNRVGFVPGIDVRTDGGSVAAPPSHRSDGDYAWEVVPSDCPIADAPEWLLSLIDPPQALRLPHRPIQTRGLDRLARYVAAAIDDECAELAAMAPNTGRNLRLFVAAARLGELVGAGLAPAEYVEEALRAAAAACGLSQEDGPRAVVATIRSGFARGVRQPRGVKL